MVVDSNLHGPTLEAIVEQLQDELAADPLIGFPDNDLLPAFVRALYEGSAFESRLLLDAETEQAALEDFLTATKLAELSEGDLDVRVAADERSVAVTDGEHVIVPVGIPNKAAGFVDTDEEFVEALTDAYEDAWADAAEFDSTVPALDALLDAFADTTSDPIADDFEAVLAAAGSLGGRDDPIDIIELAILLGARHEEQVYDLSEWGEVTGLASKATFSRKKSQLEDVGLVETESIPMDVGRPRLRLILADDELADVDPEAFIDIARSPLE